LKPIGFEVNERIRRSPARNSWPCTYVSDRGCTTPSPPASLTAATSSGFEQGYMGPPISGTSTPACRVNAVSIDSACLRLHETESPAHFARRDERVFPIEALGRHVEFAVPGDGGDGDTRNRSDRAARLLVVRHRKSRDDAAHRRRQ